MNRGFTLIEVIIAMGLMSVMMLGMLSMTDITMRSANGVRQSLDMANLNASLTMTLGKQDSCTKVFAGQPYTMPGMTEVSVLLPGSIVPVKAGNLRDGWKFNSVRLEHISNVKADEQIAQLAFDAEKVNRTPGSQTTSRKYLLRLGTKTDSEVVSCYSFDDLSMAKICENFSGVFDPVTQHCGAIP